ncbi:MAG: TIGR02117 family protein [Bacteroidetes bacterium]|nr:TIGR02117 family protein [Bacteroidota bacterium]
MTHAIQIIRKTGLFILVFVEMVLGFLLVYMNFALLMALLPYGADEPASGVRIYIKTNGVHTDICLPVESAYMDWKTVIPVAHYPQVSRFSYLSVGWGDKGFFLDTPTWADLKFSTAFKAAFLPSETAMHVQYLEQEPTVSESVRMKFITPENYLELIEYVTASFRKKEDGGVDLIPDRGYWSNDNFYEANGSYHLFNTCNVWTNEALKIAGVRTAVIALFSDGIMRHL